VYPFFFPRSEVGSYAVGHGYELDHEKVETGRVEQGEGGVDVRRRRVCGGLRGRLCHDGDFWGLEAVCSGLMRLAVVVMVRANGCRSCGVSQGGVYGVSGFVDVRDVRRTGYECFEDRCMYVAHVSVFASHRRQL
jgi:hypothetical protein